MPSRFDNANKIDGIACFMGSLETYLTKRKTSSKPIVGRIK